MADDPLSSRNMSSFSIKHCDHHHVERGSYSSSENGPFPPIFETRSPPPLALGSAIKGDYSLGSCGFPEGLPLHHTDSPLGLSLASKGVAKTLPGGPPVSSQKAKRPPNPWILYRAAKYKELKDGKVIPNWELALIQTGLWRPELIRGSNEIGDQEKGSDVCNFTSYNALPQSSLSKVFSLLWKWERPEVRQKYSYLSQLKKQEVSYKQELFPLTEWSINDSTLTTNMHPSDEIVSYLPVSESFNANATQTCEA
jgi:hypothetical protein